MISETTFAKKFTSFWSQLLPNANYYVRVVNEGMLESFYAPIKPVRSDNVALCNIISFEIFKVFLHGGVLKPQIQDNSFFSTKNFSDIVEQKINFLKGFQFRSSGIKSINSEELIDIGKLSLETINRYGSRRHMLTINPQFDGIGYLNQAKGDLLDGRTLVEFKAGYRKFSVYDIRQVLVYLTMNFFSRSPLEINEIELYNPRMGIAFSVSVEELCEAVSALLPQDLFNEIQMFVAENNFIEID